ncbi:MAG: hypothetical protein AB1295_00870 [Candidatus Micrarchaeota archaeon]
MATSKRKIKTPRLAQISDDQERIERPAPKKKKKSLRSFHGTPDRFSLSNLAKVLTSGERLDMLSAVDRLKGRARVLVELALFSNFQFVRLAAVQHLAKDRDALVDIAKFCHYDDTRACALDELSANSNGLVEVACSSLFVSTRKDAVAIMKDKSALTDVAVRSPHKDSRTLAMERIANNPAALKRVAEESSYRSVRMSAIDRLASNVESLCSLVFSRHTEVKKAAASKLSTHVEELSDPDALMEIAKMSPNEDARYIAVGRLSNDPWSLRAIVTDASHKDAKTTALMLLSDMVAELDDPEILADVAMLSPYPDCRVSAVERLVGQSSALQSVASKSKYKDAREQALDKLKDDTEALKSVSRLSKYSDTRKRAHTLVSHPETFKSELTRILG